MAPRRTLAEELAELATPQPAPGKLFCRRHRLIVHGYQDCVVDKDFFHLLQRPILKRTSWLKLLPWKMAPSTWSRSSSQPGQERNPLFPAQHIKHRTGSQPCWPCCCRKAKEKKNRLRADIDLQGAAYSGKRTSRAAAFDDASSSGKSAADRYACCS